MKNHFKVNCKININIIINIIMAVASGWFTACGSLSAKSTSSFKVRMLGTYIQPEGATGTSTPRSYTVTFKGVTLTDSDGTAVKMYTGDATELTIIDRGQIVYSKLNMTDYNTKIMTTAVVEFDPNILVTSKEGVESKIVLADGNQTLIENFTVTKSKEQVLTIKMAWGDTITPGEDGVDTVSLPTISLLYEAQ
jgi:hypothetical protein